MNDERSADSKTTVLIVDDSEVISRLLRAVVEYEGYQVVGVAEDGERALHIYDEEDPDVILLDIALPMMSGLEVLEQVKGRKECRTKVIMISGILDPETMAQCTLLGAEAFVPKPFSIDKIRNVLSQVLATHPRERADVGTMSRSVRRRTAAQRGIREGVAEPPGRA